MAFLRFVLRTPFGRFGHGPAAETTLLGLVTSKSHFLNFSKNSKATADAAKTVAARYLAEGNEALARRTLHIHVADMRIAGEYASLADRTHRLAKSLYRQPSGTVAAYASLIADVASAERNVATAAIRVAALEQRMVKDGLTQASPLGGRSEADEDAKATAADFGAVDAILRDMRVMAALNSVGETLASMKKCK